VVYGKYEHVFNDIEMFLGTECTNNLLNACGVSDIQIVIRV